MPYPEPSPSGYIYIYIYTHTHTRYIPTMVFYGEAVGASIEKALASFLIPTGCLFLVISRRSKKKKRKKKREGGRNGEL